MAYVILQINGDTIPNILDWEVISLCDTESKVKDISLITIGRNMQHILDSYFQTKWNTFSIDVVLIENQIYSSCYSHENITRNDYSILYTKKYFSNRILVLFQ